MQQGEISKGMGRLLSTRVVAIEPGSAADKITDKKLRSKHPEHPPPDITPDTIPHDDLDDVDVLDHRLTWAR